MCHNNSAKYKFLEIYSLSLSFSAFRCHMFDDHAHKGHHRIINIDIMPCLYVRVQGQEGAGPPCIPVLFCAKNCRRFLVSKQYCLCILYTTCIVVCLRRISIVPSLWTRVQSNLAKCKFLKFSRQSVSLSFSALAIRLSMTTPAAVLVSSTSRQQNEQMHSSTTCAVQAQLAMHMWLQYGPGPRLEKKLVFLKTGF